MASMVRERRISPVELMDAHFRQIAAHNPQINAFVVLLEEQARAAAKRAEDAVMRGDELGALHGVPVTVKDSFDMMGLPTLCGSRFRLGHRAAADATAVARMRAAGAIVVGKTNCPEFLSNYETDNYITGRTNNPWNLEYTPGGSSGGESAAIAAFFSAGGIGSDGGGSIRIPAHFSGHRRAEANTGPCLGCRPFSRDQPPRRPAGSGGTDGTHGRGCAALVHGVGGI